MPKIGESGGEKPAKGKRVIPRDVKLTNRGPVGLHDKLSDAAKAKAAADGFVSTAERIAAEIKAAKRDKIAPALAAMVVDIASLVPDPDNARLHPEANLDAIRLSLARYGQLKPIVVRKRGRVVLAGNGTREAALSLGWTKMAASFVDLDDVAATGFALADNRTAELARWDTEVVARIERLQAEAGRPVVGWSDDEVIGMRLAGWVEPPAEFPEVDEGIEIEHRCPKCGFSWSGGVTKKRPANAENDDAED